MAENYFQKELETMPVEQIKALQKERLIKTVNHVYKNVPYYAQMMDKAGVKPEDIKELKDLAKLLPTKSEPIKPGPLVNAMASICEFWIPACLIASATTGTIFC